MLRNGFAFLRDPILRPLDNIETRDALIDWTDSTNPVEAAWPDADVIIGNPPFLGGKLLRKGLGDEYVGALFRIFDRRVPREADFVTYWHEKARAMVESGRARRVGLLATQGIRGGANRRVLERVKQTGDIFAAWSDEPWVLSGAAVHVSFLGYDDGSTKDKVLNGHSVAEINADLTAGIDLTKARRLPENFGIAFMGDTKGGPFDLSAEQAYPMLDAHNPDGRSNRVVVRAGLTVSTSLVGQETCGLSILASTCPARKRPYTQPLTPTWRTWSSPLERKTSARHTPSTGGSTLNHGQECVPCFQGSVDISALPA